ncbi:uncharacterized protein L201_003186 [Kwoniella dendrophila CBS 6074]|uniref:Uncharacterized protein n=1 Tax=Kwoniella dendrophila CBS 6074 TaxID=1295534 RepID=A0AAX4JTL9_9TREE
MVFTLPSLPSGILENFIDTSPQVFYPTSSSTTRNTPTKRTCPNINTDQRHRSSSRSSVNSNNHYYKYDDIYELPQKTSIQLLPPTTPTKTPKKQHLGNLLPASASLDDLTGDWEPLPNGGLAEKRRLSISNSINNKSVTETYGNGLLRYCSSPTKLPTTTTNTTPTRPVHRRCHSALPSTSSPSTSTIKGKIKDEIPSPLITGKLKEFSISKNPLASTSAISLPTLKEGEFDENHHQPLWSNRQNQDGNGSISPSPLVRPHDRKSSKSKITPASPSLRSELSLDFKEEEEELVDDTDQNELPHDVKPPKIKSLKRHNTTLSSVPPPLDSQPHYSSMPPPPLNPINITYSPSSSKVRHRKSFRTTSISTSMTRPLLSPRSWSVQDIHSLSPSSSSSSSISSTNCDKNKGLHSRRSSVESTSSVSDIAVLATWSFPNSNIDPTKVNDDDRDTDKKGDVERGRKPGPSSERLKERLRNIPGIETGSFRFPSSGSLPLLNNNNNNKLERGKDHKKLMRNNTTVIKPSKPILPPHLKIGHRHTHSSPNLLTIPSSTSSPTLSRQGQGQGLMGPPSSSFSTPSVGNPAFPPPPKPVQRRPTTSRLRHPNPLSMSTNHHNHHHQTQTFLTSSSTGIGSMGLGSSPGSGSIDSLSLSDISSSTSASNIYSESSPTNSIKSLPSVNIPSDSEDGIGKQDKTWWSSSPFTSFKRNRSESQSSERNNTQLGVFQNKQDVIEVLPQLVNRKEYEWEQSIKVVDDHNDDGDDEQYIDLDNM